MIAFTATPLETYSSLHKVSIPCLPYLTLAFNFNIQLSPKIIAQPQLTFNLRDADNKPNNNADLEIQNLTRWRMSIAECSSFEDYLQTLKSNHLKNYRNTQKAFEQSGVNISFIKGDWTDYVDTVYQLYLNVAKRHGSQLYDLNFFRHIAKIDAYKIICAWHQQILISVLIIVDEKPIYHSMLCGFDYQHSTNINAYSLLHYELIRIAITAKNYTIVDAGITANKAKSMMNFKPIVSCMDVSANNIILKSMLRMFSRIFTTTINEQGKLKLKLFRYRAQYD